MADYIQLSAYGMALFFVVYIVYTLVKSNTSAREKNFVEKMDKLCQEFTGTNALEPALRKILEQNSPVNSYFEAIVKKVDSGENLPAALFETSQETNDEFFKKLCLLMASANVSGGAEILYAAIKNIKERLDYNQKEDSKITLNVFFMNLVFAVVMPLLFYFMLIAVQTAITTIIAVFISYVALCSSIIEGVMYKRFVAALIRVPLIMSLFYIVLFYIGPKLLGGFGL